MAITADISNGKFIINNPTPELAGIQIEYSGNVFFNPTLPEGWALRAGKSVILIFNMGTNILSSNDILFTYEGELNIRYSFGSNKMGEKIIMSIPNQRMVWNDSTMWGLTEKAENWDSIKNKNISKSKPYRRLGRSYTSIHEKGNRGITKIPIRSNLYTEGGEYKLKGKDYKGDYHIHTDMNYAMTGKTHNDSSKYLEKDDAKIVTQQKKTTNQSTSRTGDRY